MDPSLSSLSSGWIPDCYPFMLSHLYVFWHLFKVVTNKERDKKRLADFSRLKSYLPKI
jgi:hypothetical protein